MMFTVVSSVTVVELYCRVVNVNKFESHFANKVAGTLVDNALNLPLDVAGNLVAPDYRVGGEKFKLRTLVLFSTCSQTLHLPRTMPGTLHTWSGFGEGSGILFCNMATMHSGSHCSVT